MISTPHPPSSRQPRLAALSKSVPAGILCLILSGCMVGPDYAPPRIELPKIWGSATPELATQSGAPELARWWTRLSDPTLDQLIEDAVKGSPDIDSAMAKIRESRALVKQAGGALQPSLSGDLSATRSDDLAKGTGGPDGQFRAGFDAAWEIDLFGGNRRALEAARYGLEESEEQLEDALLTLIGDVASAYVDVRSAQERIILARRTAELQRETEILTIAKFDVGSASSLDVAKASGQRQSTEASIPSLESSRKQAVHRLGVLLGREPAALNALFDQERTVPSPPQTMPVGIPADILSRRPDIRALERALAQSTASIGVAEAKRYPTISLSGAISTNAAQFGNIGSRTSIGWSFGPTISVPLFQGGALEAGVEAAEAQRDQSFIAWRQGVLSALEETENAIVQLDQERIRHQRLEEAVRSYRSASSLAHILYQGGSTSLLEVLDADRSLLSAEDSLISSRASATTAYISLNKALGGGWDGALEERPTPIGAPRTADAQSSAE